MYGFYKLGYRMYVYTKIWYFSLYLVILFIFFTTMTPVVSGRFPFLNTVELIQSWDQFISFWSVWACWYHFFRFRGYKTTINTFNSFWRLTDKTNGDRKSAKLCTCLCSSCIRYSCESSPIEGLAGLVWEALIAINDNITVGESEPNY